MSKDLSIDFSRRLDLKDPLFKYRDEFNIPKFQNEDSIYFTGNSLGLQLKKHDIYLKQELEDWKKMGVDGHFHAKTPWFDYHKSLVQYTSNLVGAKEKEVVNSKNRRNL